MPNGHKHNPLKDLNHFDPEVELADWRKGREEELAYVNAQLGEADEQ